MKRGENSFLSIGRKISPEVWLERVKSLPENEQKHVARILWWDWFAHRLNSERWPHLDEYLFYKEGEEQMDDDLFRKALVNVGYPEEEAKKRIK